MTPANYLPYGANANAPGTFAYTGQRIDPESGLYYYRARHYSPLLGRFLQPDPIRYRGGINLYAYVGNDPLNATDPSGLVADAIGGAANDFYNQTILQAAKDTAGYAQDLVNDPAYFMHAIGPSLVGLGMSTSATLAGTSAAEETTTLFRVVGPDELADIEASGGYSGSPGGLGSGLID